MASSNSESEETRELLFNAPKESSVNKVQSNSDRVYHEALEATGYGFFHFILVVVAGWGIASDSVEILMVSFVVPAAKYDLQLGDVSEGAVESVIFVGMMIGGLFWGSWSDAVGRKTSLINSLLINGFAGLISAFMPNFGLFLFFRLISGIGVGGSFPVVFSYFYEFFTPKRKGPFVIILATFWSFGQILTAILALVVLREPCSISASLGAVVLRNWRVFVMLCTVPALSGALFLICMPESPAWHYQRGGKDKARRILLRIRKINNIFSCCKRNRKELPVDILFPEEPEDYKSGYETISKSFIDEEEEVKPSSSWTAKAANTCKSIPQKLKTGLLGFIKLFHRSLLRMTIIMILIYWTLSYGYYGLVIWFPGYFQRLQGQSNTSCVLNCTNVGQNSNFTSSGDSCTKPYLDSVYSTLANAPGTLIGLLTINIVGERFQLMVSMLISGLSVFFIWFLPPVESTVVILSCLFSGFSIVGWNALDIMSVDGFPTDVRSTAFGILAGVGRLASISGIFTFTSLQESAPEIPILIVFIMLIIGSICTIFLPLTKDPEQMTILRRKLLPRIKSFIKKRKSKTRK